MRQLDIPYHINKGACPFLLPIIVVSTEFLRAAEINLSYGPNPSIQAETEQGRSRWVKCVVCLQVVNPLLDFLDMTLSCQSDLTWETA